MDFSKLSQNEKLAVYGSAAVVVAGLISSWGGLLFLSILAALGMLAVVFLPQLSASTALPGSKGTLMAALGIVAAVAAVITALQWLSYLGVLGSMYTIMFLVALVGSLVMAWAGWQELQSEGGTWRFGSATTTPGVATAEPATPTSAVDHAPSDPVTAPVEPERSVTSTSADDTPIDGREDPRPTG
jgi:hypothetical protein